MKLIAFWGSLIEKHWFWISVIFILALAFSVRTYKLDQVPAGMTWDEAAIGYNGFAIVHLRRDEWLTKLPLSFRSFGDYKSPLSIYLNGAFTFLFGLNLWAVRVPFALSGVASVLGMLLLIRELYTLYSEKIDLKHKTKLSAFTSLSIGMLTALSVWHVHFSRAGFESGLALTWIIWGVFFFYFFLRLRVHSVISYLLILSSGSCLSLSLYTYHSAKIMVPLLVLSLVVLHKNELLGKVRQVTLAATLSLISLLPLLSDTLYGQGSARFSQTSLFDGSLTSTQIIYTVLKNFLLHLTPQFLLFGETATLRHGDGQWGVIYITEFILLIAAIAMIILACINQRHVLHHKMVRSVGLIGVLWIIAGILPAAIGKEIPHPNRALLALPGFYLLISIPIYWGLQKITSTITSGKTLPRILFGMLLLCHILLFLTHQNEYYTQYYHQSEESFFYGYEDAFDFAITHEEEAEKILFTSYYGQPYIYALFFRQTLPDWYHWGSLVKYEFTDRITSGDLNRKNTLIIATPDEIDPALGQELVIAPNGKVKFVLIKTPK